MLLDFSIVVYLFKNDVSQKKCAESLAVQGVFNKIKETISKYASKKGKFQKSFTFQVYLHFSENFLDLEFNKYLTLSQSYFRKWTF